MTIGPSRNAPIGVFDSGVGGLTVARAIRDSLPHESITYIGDTQHSPYGTKSIADVREYSLAVLDQLVDQGVKLLVIACNTASAAMLRDARERYSVPVVEVIQPAVRAALAATRNNRVGVIGTSSTINSHAYDDAFAAAQQIELFTAAAPRFVEFVEAGQTSGDEVLQSAREYLQPLIRDNIDTLVLGCTHYPFLRGAISYVMGDQVRLVSSDNETAKDVYRVLVDGELDRTDPSDPSYVYEATGDNTAEFIRLANMFLGPQVVNVEHTPTGVISLENVTPSPGAKGSND